MEYRRFGQKMVIRLDPGEEILSTLREAAVKENVRLASVSAIGATDNFTVGVYDVQKQIYLHQKLITQVLLLNMQW